MSNEPGGKLAAIRQIYFRTGPATILQDFDRAIDLIKAIESEADREKASVYMEGLAALRREFRRKRR